MMTFNSEGPFNDNQQTKGRHASATSVADPAPFTICLLTRTALGCYVNERQLLLVLEVRARTSNTTNSLSLRDMPGSSPKVRHLDPGLLRSSPQVHGRWLQGRHSLIQEGQGSEEGQGKSSGPMGQGLGARAVRRQQPQPVYISTRSSNQPCNIQT